MEQRVKCLLSGCVLNDCNLLWSCYQCLVNLITLSKQVKSWNLVRTGQYSLGTTSRHVSAILPQPQCVKIPSSWLHFTLVTDIPIFTNTWNPPIHCSYRVVLPARRTGTNFTCNFTQNSVEMHCSPIMVLFFSWNIWQRNSVKCILINHCTEMLRLIKKIHSIIMKHGLDLELDENNPYVKTNLKHQIKSYAYEMDI